MQSYPTRDPPTYPTRDLSTYPTRDLSTYPTRGVFRHVTGLYSEWSTSFTFRHIAVGRGSCLAPVHHPINNRDDETVQQGGCEQAAKDDLGHGALYLVARQVAVQSQGYHREG